MAHLSSPHHFPQQPQQPVSAHAIRPTHTTTSCAAVAERGGSGAPGPWPSSKQSPAANRTASPSQITAASPPSPHQLFGPKKAGHPAAYNEDPQFAAFKQCNDPAVAKALRVGQRQRLDPTAVAEHLGGSSLYSRLALALAKSQAVDAKEVFEAFEFCERVRRRMRRPNLVDLACGHGLVGILMTALEPTHIRRVVLLDRRKPASHDTILRAVAAVAPWVADGRIVFLEQDLYAADVWSQLSEALSQPVMTTGGPLLGASLLASSSDGESGGGSGASSSASSASSSASSTITSSNSSTIASSNSSTIASSSSMMSTLAHSDDTAVGRMQQSAPSISVFAKGGEEKELMQRAAVNPPAQLPSILAVHACGNATDRCLDIAALWRCPVAVMPCCYTSTARGSPFGVRRALGTSVAADVHRSYRLDAAGYVSVDWLCIPQAITDMNRILLAA
ncbi:MAG: hypothetical protein WDW38_007259 [Sanguina aurantia]